MERIPSREEIAAARNQLYPGWHTYSPTEPDPSLWPYYRVECRTGKEIELALLAKPYRARVDIVYLVPDQVMKDDVEADVQEIVNVSTAVGFFMVSTDRLSDTLLRQAHKRREIVMHSSPV